MGLRRKHSRPPTSHMQTRQHKYIKASAMRRLSIGELQPRKSFTWLKRASGYDHSVTLNPNSPLVKLFKTSSPPKSPQLVKRAGGKPTVDSPTPLTFGFNPSLVTTNNWSTSPSPQPRAALKTPKLYTRRRRAVASQVQTD